MVQIIQGKDITLAQLIDEFGLQVADDEHFFSEWQQDLPELSDLEKQSLNQVKAEYLHLSRYQILEPVVKKVVLSPILRLAGFYQLPFYIASSEEVRISSEDEGTIIRGRIDILVFHPPFWVLVIEAKRAEYSLEVAISQALVYMLANPGNEKPTFGFVTNGREFQFIKLTKQRGCGTYRARKLPSYRGMKVLSQVPVLTRMGSASSPPPLTIQRRLCLFMRGMWKV